MVAAQALKDETIDRRAAGRQLLIDKHRLQESRPVEDLVGGAVGATAVIGPGDFDIVAAGGKAAGLPNRRVGPAGRIMDPVVAAVTGRIARSEPAASRLRIASVAIVDDDRSLTLDDRGRGCGDNVVNLVAF